MKVLLTGANGYIAKALYNALKNTHDVTKITRADFNLIDTHETLKYFSNNYFDVVIHCAVTGGSRLRDDTWIDMDGNLRMYYNILSCRDSFGKLIHFGSGAELAAGNTPYGLSKTVISNSIVEQEKFYNIRIFGVFDENELDTRFIKANIKKYINKEPLVIHKNKKMDFFYMRDLIALVDHYINNNSPIKKIDCTYLVSPTLFSIAEKINNLSSYKSDIKILDQSGLDCPYIGTYVPCLEYIGLDEGISQVYAKLTTIC